MLRAWVLPALVSILLVSVGTGDPAHAQNAGTKEGAPAGKTSKKSEPAEAQGALDGAAKALEAGKADQAVQQINALLSGTRLQGRAMARALYLRGAAYQRQGKPAQAIADLTSALWLRGGLSDADRAAATALRADAYRQAGLHELADADAKKVGGAASSADSTSTVSWQSEIAVRKAEPEPKSLAAAQPATSSSGLSGFFSNLFGGSSNAQQPSATRQEAPRPVPAKQPSIGDAWATSVEGRAAGAAKQSASIREETAAIVPKQDAVLKPATAPSKAQGRYLLQVAAVRGRADAQAMAARLKRDYAAMLGGREPEVDETVIGNMGTFYRVRVGPFAEAAETGPLCAKLKGAGLDCLVMAE